MTRRNRIVSRYQSLPVPVRYGLIGVCLCVLFILFDVSINYNSPLAQMNRSIKELDAFADKRSAKRTASTVADLLAEKALLIELEHQALDQPSIFDQTGRDFAELNQRLATVEMALTPAHGGSYARANDLLRRAANNLEGMSQKGKLLRSEYNAREAAVYEQLGNLYLQQGAFEAGPGKSTSSEYYRRARINFMMARDFIRLVDQNTLAEARILSQMASSSLYLEEWDEASQYAKQGAAIIKMLPGRNAQPEEIVRVIKVCDALNVVFRELEDDTASQQMWDKVFSLHPQK